MAAPTAEDGAFGKARRDALHAATWTVLRLSAAPTIAALKMTSGTEEHDGA